MGVTDRFEESLGPMSLWRLWCWAARGSWTVKDLHGFGEVFFFGDWDHAVTGTSSSHIQFFKQPIDTSHACQLLRFLHVTRNGNSWVKSKSHYVAQVHL